MQKGFTLMELMVALAVAGILVSSALGLYGMFHREYVHILAAYDSRSTEYIHTMQKSIRELRGCPDANRL
ncbi:MAG: prepilin-type N-terminal cleavage/methylation domain-containing protein [Fibrobacter sp.]|jgi:prepilin-type N-terminal cleavage/methylation domain-containing protein|nr:prepilin-type N-terminal cleavage/methylation domain-containing protein [Fibrobacter sp.]